MSLTPCPQAIHTCALLALGGLVLVKLRRKEYCTIFRGDVKSCVSTLLPTSADHGYDPGVALLKEGQDAAGPTS